MTAPADRHRDHEDMVRVMTAMDRAMRRVPRGLGSVAPWQVWDEQTTHAFEYPGSALTRRRVATVIARAVRAGLVVRHGPYGQRETHWGYSPARGWRRRV